MSKRVIKSSNTQRVNDCILSQLLLFSCFRSLRTILSDAPQALQTVGLKRLMYETAVQCKFFDLIGLFTES